MKKLFVILLSLMTLSFSGTYKGKVYFFSYFKGNGEDGLYLAYSRDGYNFIALNNDRPYSYSDGWNIKADA